MIYLTNYVVNALLGTHRGTPSGPFMIIGRKIVFFHITLALANLIICVEMDRYEELLLLYYVCKFGAWWLACIIMNAMVVGSIPTWENELY